MYPAETKFTGVPQVDFTSVLLDQVACQDLSTADKVDHQPSGTWIRHHHSDDDGERPKSTTYFNPEPPMNGSTHLQQNDVVTGSHTNVSLGTHYLYELLRRKELHPSNLGLIQNLIIQMLCAFPEKRMTKDSHPSFIHHSMFDRSTNVLNIEDPLIICRTIAQRFTCRKESQTSSLWDDIFIEQARTYDNRAAFDKWLTLSGAQAVTVYLLMLATEGENVLNYYPNLPVALLFTLGILFGELNKMVDGFQASKDAFGNSPAWDEWIFAESKLRTAMVYFMMAQHFKLYFGLPCDRDEDYTFEEIDLPASKALWEAKDSASWQQEYKLKEATGLESRSMSGISTSLKFLDLVKSNQWQSQKISPQGSNAVVEEMIKEWQKHMDDFGILVVLCSTVRSEQASEVYNSI